MRKLMAMVLVMALTTTTYGATLELSASSDALPISGGTIDVRVSVTPDETYFKGLSLFLTEETNAGVMVTARTITGAGPYYYLVDPTTNDAHLFGTKPAYINNRTLNPSTADLGVTTRDPDYGDMAGQVMTLELTIPSGGPGYLTISAAGSTYVKEDNSAGQFDTINDIVLWIGAPEPASLALLAFGGLALLRRR